MCYICFDWMFFVKGYEGFIVKYWVYLRVFFLLRYVVVRGVWLKNDFVFVVWILEVGLILVLWVLIKVGGRWKEVLFLWWDVFFVFLCFLVLSLLIRLLFVLNLLLSLDDLFFCCLMFWWWRVVWEREYKMCFLFV